MALNSIDMNILAYLTYEHRMLKTVNGHAKERWDLNDNGMIVVEKWFDSRIEELTKQKED